MEVARGRVGIERIRTFGAFSGGESEIEAIVTDDRRGRIYYSDALFGVREYGADPHDADDVSNGN